MRFARVLGLTALIFWSVPVAAADIAEYFRLYVTHSALSAHKSLLDFLDGRELLNGGAERILTASTTRTVIVDRPNGYVQVSDSAGTDQVLTMAIYRKVDGGEVLVVGSSNCADGCGFSVEFFQMASDGLETVERNTVMPKIDVSRFIKPGQTGPKGIPTINYVPARVGTSLTLKPWYGYEVEETMSKTTRAALQDVVLTWDRAQGRFVTGR